MDGSTHLELRFELDVTEAEQVAGRTIDIAHAGAWAASALFVSLAIVGGALALLESGLGPVRRAVLGAVAGELVVFAIVLGLVARWLYREHCRVIDLVVARLRPAAD